MTGTGGRYRYRYLASRNLHLPPSTVHSAIRSHAQMSRKGLLTTVGVMPSNIGIPMVGRRDSLNVAVAGAVISEAFSQCGTP